MPNREFPFNQPIHPEDNRSINKAFDRNYGNRIKSGDTTPLKYTIKDGDGEPLDKQRLLAMDVTAILKYEDIVAYETEAIVTLEDETENYAGDLVARFTIQEALAPSATPYILEFHFENGESSDRFIFPSENNLDIYITPSALNSDDKAIEKSSEQRLKEIVESSQTLTDVKTQEEERIANEEARQAKYIELVDTGIMQENINQKLAESEEEYAPRLTELEQNDADLTAQLAQIAVNVKTFRAMGDGITDDTVAIQNAIDYVALLGGGTVLVPKGTYMIKAHVPTTTSSHYLRDEGGLAMKDGVTLLMTPKTILKAIPNDKPQYQIVRVYNKKNVSIIGGSVIGERLEHTGTTGQWGYGIAIAGGENILIENTITADCWGDGINIQVLGDTGVGEPARNVTIRNVYADNNRRQGMSIEGLINGIVENCQFVNTAGTAPECGVDIEPWADENIVEDIVFRDCIFSNNAGSGLTIMGEGVSRVHVDNCLIEDNEGIDGQLTIFYCRDISIRNSYFYGSKQISAVTLSENVIFDNNHIESNIGAINSSVNVRYENNTIDVSHRSSYQLMVVPAYQGQHLTRNLVFKNNIVTGADEISRRALVIDSARNTTIEGNTFRYFEGVIDAGAETQGMKILNNRFENFSKFGAALRSPGTCIGNIFTGGCYENEDQPILVSYSAQQHTMFGNIAFKQPNDPMDEQPKFGSLANLTGTFLLYENNHVADNTPYDNAIIMGVEWDKQEDPTMTRIGDSKDFVANIGIGDEVVQNDFDRAPIYREIIRETDDLGNTFVRIPKFYIRKTDDEGLLRLEISKEKTKGFYLPYVFWDFENDKELDYFYYGAYTASLSTDGTKLESKPGVEPLATTNIVQFRDFARSNGPGYQQLDIHAVDVIQTLFYVEFATLNSQSIHPGYTGGTEAKLTGGTGGVVASSGTAGADNTNQFMYRGIEDLWGHLNQWVDGVNVIDNQAWACEDANSYASNVFAAPYQKLSYVNADTNGYVKEMGFDPNRPYAQFPVTVGADTATYYSDYYAQNTDQRVALFGGNWSLNLAAGVSYRNLNYTSSLVDSNTGGRLLRKPI